MSDEGGVREVETYILIDQRGRILTDEKGLVSIWMIKRQALRDAEEISARLGVELHPVLFPEARFLKEVSEGNRIVI